MTSLLPHTGFRSDLFSGGDSRRPPRHRLERRLVRRGFLAPPAPGYLVSRSSLVTGGVGLIFATLYTAPARARRSLRTRLVYENAHEAHIMAVAEVNYYKSCGLQMIGDKTDLKAYVSGWKKGQLAAVLLMEGAH